MEVTNLCPTCAVDHGTDDRGVHCCSRGLVPLQTDCPKYRATHEEKLRVALQEILRIGLDIEYRDNEAWADAVEDALEAARESTEELLGK